MEDDRLRFLAKRNISSEDLLDIINVVAKRCFNVHAVWEKFGHAERGKKLVEYVRYHGTDDEDVKFSEFSSLAGRFSR